MKKGSRKVWMYSDTPIYHLVPERDYAGPTQDQAALKYKWNKVSYELICML